MRLTLTTDDGTVLDTRTITRDEWDTETATAWGAYHLLTSLEPGDAEREPEPEPGPHTALLAIPVWGEGDMPLIAEEVSRLVTEGTVTPYANLDAFITGTPARCACMTEDPGDGYGERVIEHSLGCTLHPEHDG